jgi:hypothetical protein
MFPVWYIKPFMGDATGSFRLSMDLENVLGVTAGANTPHAYLSPVADPHAVRSMPLNLCSKKGGVM